MDIRKKLFLCEEILILKLISSLKREKFLKESDLYNFGKKKKIE